VSSCEVGKLAPRFALTCVSADDGASRSVTLGDYAGRWLVLIFYPRDFSFVCPTELTSFSAHLADFAERDCELLGISVDTIELHREWLTTPPAEGGLGPLRFPLASDPQGDAAKAYGVWVEEKEVSTRGLFVIDPEGVLQYSVKHNLSVGRRPDVVLRVLDALQTGGLCPANWTSADGNIDPEKALRPGRILGHYRIRQSVGSGTFGSVFAAFDLRLERTVALKVLKRNVFESRNVVLAEARAAAGLNSPYICTIYAVDEEDGLPVIAMEYLNGSPLSQVIERGLERDVALDLAHQIAAGMADAHEGGVVHGDLKPANVIVTEKGIAKIVDFGLANASTRAGDVESSKPVAEADTDQADATVEFVEPETRGSIQGTPAYMSPEQANARPATAASDVFSFGLVFFELLTGRPAHPDRSALETLLLLQNQDLGPELAGQVDEPYGGLLAAMLSRDSSQRPGIREVVARL
jgi:alkyl hydroperoxide reductase subunit AhpC/predicted Ser/Thr protein kinase